MTAHEATRQEEINRIWQDHRFLWFLPGFFLGFLLGLPLRPPYPPVGWFIDGIWPEVISTVFAVAVINVLYQRFDEQRRIKDLQEQLVRDAGSTSNEIAKNAVHQLQDHRWLIGENGLLKGAYLWAANLKEVRLWAANLQGAKLGDAHLEEALLKDSHLEGADLWRAHLEGADLRNAHLEGAILEFAHLEEAYLWCANLQGAVLEFAYLEGAYLFRAHLEGAYLQYASFDENTVLPDGNKWTPDTDLTKFGANMDNSPDRFLTNTN